MSALSITSFEIIIDKILGFMGSSKSKYDDDEDGGAREGIALAVRFLVLFNFFYIFINFINPFFDDLDFTLMLVLCKF